jgi:2-C-methyl-D-erythritol 4-phosphate cytidylyltransferase
VTSITAPDFAAVFVMAGSGTRLGADVPKAFVPLGGKAMWRHAADTFASIATCRTIVLVAPADRVEEVRRAMPSAIVVDGGERRQDSVRHGLAAIPAGVGVVAIHDAARPFVTREAILAAVSQASITGAAASAVPVRDTIKRVKAGVIAETLDRSVLWQAQTPQCFRLDVIRSAHAAAEAQGWDVTDDCALLERLGHAVAVVRGDVWNFKITEPDDLSAAEAFLAHRRGPGKERP